MHICMYMNIYMNTHTHTRARAHTHTHTHTNICMNIHLLRVAGVAPITRANEQPLHANNEYISIECCRCCTYYTGE